MLSKSNYVPEVGWEFKKLVFFPHNLKQVVQLPVYQRGSGHSARLLHMGDSASEPWSLSHQTFALQSSDKILIFNFARWKKLKIPLIRAPPERQLGRRLCKRRRGPSNRWDHHVNFAFLGCYQQEDKNSGISKYQTSPLPFFPLQICY